MKQYQLIIYNRWGQIIFKTNEPGKEWDGTLKGITLTTQAFVWTCTYQFDGEEIKTEKGTVMLVR